MKKDQTKKTFQKNHEKLSNVFKALSNPKRINLLLAIRSDECRVTNMSKCINESLPIVSQQLAILKRHGVVERTRTDKNEVFYNITNEFASKVLDLVDEYNLKSKSKK
jgi:DNA-binding transcriptional ArsR family regulator